MGAIGKIVKSVVDTVKDVVTSAVNVVGSGLKCMDSLMKGDLKGAASAFMDGCKSAISCAMNAATLAPGMGMPAGMMLKASMMGGKMGGLLGGASQMLPSLMNAMPMPMALMGNMGGMGGGMGMGLNLGPQGLSVSGQGLLGGGSLSLGPQGFSASGQGLLGGGSVSVGPQGASASVNMGVGSAQQAVTQSLYAQNNASAAGMGMGGYGLAPMMGGMGQSPAQAAAGTLSTFLKDSNQSLAGIFGQGAGGKDFCLGRTEMMALANNTSGKVPPSVQQAAQFMVQNPAAFEAIDTMNGRFNDGKVSVSGLRDAASGIGQGAALGGQPMMGSVMPQGGAYGAPMMPQGGGYGAPMMPQGGGYGAPMMPQGGGYGGAPMMPQGGYGGGGMQAPGSTMGAPNGTSSGQAADSIKQGVGGAEAATAQSMAAQDKLSALQQWASTQTALLKLRGDLNDAMNNFIKGVGSSIKSASQ